MITLTNSCSRTSSSAINSGIHLVHHVPVCPKIEEHFDAYDGHRNLKINMTRVVQVRKVKAIQHQNLEALIDNGTNAGVACIIFESFPRIQANYQM